MLGRHFLFPLKQIIADPKINGPGIYYPERGEGKDLLTSAEVPNGTAAVSVTSAETTKVKNLTTPFFLVFFKRFMKS